MSNHALPISLSHFGEAIKELPLEILYAKFTEINNSIYHLELSNLQLEPYAKGSQASSSGQPDMDFLDAIKENKLVITKMHQRLSLLKAEIERHGINWAEFQNNGGFKESINQVIDTAPSDQNDTSRPISITSADSSSLDSEKFNGNTRIDLLREVDGVLPIFRQTSSVHDSAPEREGTRQNISGNRGTIYTEDQGIYL